MLSGVACAKDGVAAATQMTANIVRNMAILFLPFNPPIHLRFQYIERNSALAENNIMKFA